MEPDRDLKGLRVLVVEDEMLVSLMIEDVLTDEGYTIVGPYNRLAGALEAARAEAIDVAVLDVNLAGEKSYPVAEALAGRGIPFLFLSGYGESALPAEHQNWRVCSKPFRVEELTSIIREVATGRSHRE